jgi:hypothetical protein
MLTLAHAWSRKQRWLIATSAALGLVLLTAVISGYERYYRGPGEEALYGTWLDPMFDSDDIQYWEFRSDHTFAIVMMIGGEKTSIVEGRWYAGGLNIYLRFPADFTGPARPAVMRIVDISSQQFTVRFPDQSRVYLFKKATLDSPHASNQSVQLTATRCAFTFQMTKTFSLRSTLALGGGSSLLSR